MDKNHICGACSGGFETEADYVAHVCDRTNYTPADIEHHDALTNGMHSRASISALERGEVRKENGGV